MGTLGRANGSRSSTKFQPSHKRISRNFIDVIWKNWTLLVDIIGSNEKTDMAVTKTAEGFRVAFVNHDTRDVPLLFRPANPGTGKPAWIDLANGRAINTVSESLKLTIPASGFRAVEFRRN